MAPFETIYIDSMVAACNGGGGPLGHPKVYLNLSAEGQVECPYCSRLFVHGSKRGHGANGHAAETPAATAPEDRASPAPGSAGAPTVPAGPAKP